MQIEQLSWTDARGWQGGHPLSSAALVLYFGSPDTIAAPDRFGELQTRYPNAHILGCSSDSQISGNEIVEDGIVAVAIQLRSAHVRAASVCIDDAAQSGRCGEVLGDELAGRDLVGVLVLSDGLLVNGSELTRGISRRLPAGVPVSGGLAADGPRFATTLVGLDAPPQRGRIAAIGFYGDSLRLRTGSAGGWSEFGPRRRISASRGNVLHMLDGEPALDLYERYLGPDDAKALPSSALLFPLKVFDPLLPEHGVVRTVLSIDRAARTMTFAGDVPQGWTAQLMRGTIDRLATGAGQAARQVADGAPPLDADSLILMVSCIGRRLLMGQRTIFEVDAASQELGPDAVRLGFYSYGEICPHDLSGRGEMHNQTMTITSICEVA